MHGCWLRTNLHVHALARHLLARAHALAQVDGLLPEHVVECVEVVPCERLAAVVQRACADGMIKREGGKGKGGRVGGSVIRSGEKGIEIVERRTCKHIMGVIGERRRGCNWASPSVSTKQSMWRGCSCLLLCQQTKETDVLGFRCFTLWQGEELGDEDRKRNETAWTDQRITLNAWSRSNNEQIPNTSNQY